RSTVVAPGRERVHMLSWVAMERIYEHEILPNPKLRKEAGERPLRINAKRLTDGELLVKLRSFGVEIDHAWLERECARALSAQEIAGLLMDKSTSQGQESDWIWIGVASLCRRWFPEQPSFEVLDDRVQNGYELLKTSGAVAACRIWLEAWTDVLRLLDKAGIQSIEEFDERFRGTESLFNWIQDLESELWNAGLDDRQFLSARIAMCEEAMRRFPSDDGLMVENRRRAVAESYFELDETDKAEALYREWLDADPCWGWGWIGWSDCYRFTRTERVDLNRCEQILREGFAIADVRDRADIADRLADVCEEQGRDEEAKEFRRQSERRDTAAEVSRTVSSAGKVLRQKTQVNFGGAGLPLSELSNVAAMLRETPTMPVTRQKVGRNEPCPCGSGKKYKKCCGT
ncbi:MAG TPA: SEC-C metal-binding domain-containing protein, partial [Bryobacteraceae bacterium]